MRISKGHSIRGGAQVSIQRLEERRLLCEFVLPTEFANGGETRNLPSSLSLLVIRVEYLDNDQVFTNPVQATLTEAELKDQMAWVNAKYERNSQLRPGGPFQFNFYLDPTTQNPAPVVTLDHNYSFYTNNDAVWMGEASAKMQAASGGLINPANFDRVLFYIPDTHEPRYAGVAYGHRAVVKNPYRADLQKDTGDVVLHELGHTLGLSHAS